MTDTLPEMWWPSPSAFDDLTVEDAENGFDLSAPDDTECGEWLAFWAQDEAHHKIFEDEFTAVLRNYANKVLETHGKDEDLPDWENSDSVQTEDVGPGSQP
jgi:hypothetical protein